MSSSSIGNQFEELIRIVERLRGPDGCPWDKEQTSSSLISYLLEETYEVIEAIDEKNWDGLKCFIWFFKQRLQKRMNYLIYLNL